MGETRMSARERELLVPGRNFSAPELGICRSGPERLAPLRQRERSVKIKLKSFDRALASPLRRKLCRGASSFCGTFFFARLSQRIFIFRYVFSSIYMDGTAIAS